MDSPSTTGTVTRWLDTRIDRTIAELKLAGHTNSEIAGHLGCALRTVTLRLSRIRKTWQNEEAS
jgi:DNA-directed RNA polymerase specialized sigma24 family protein